MKRILLLLAILLIPLSSRSEKDGEAAYRPEPLPTKTTFDLLSPEERSRILETALRLHGESKGIPRSSDDLHLLRAKITLDHESAPYYEHMARAFEDAQVSKEQFLRSMRFKTMVGYLYVRPVSLQELEVLIDQAKKPVIVDFWGPWCRPCRELDPLIEETARQQHRKIDFFKIVVPTPDKNERKAFGVRALPTLRLYRRGQLADEIVGFSRTEYRKELRRMLAKAVP